MKLIPANVGANRKNLTALGVLVVILVGVFFYENSSSNTPAAPTVSTNTAPAVSPVPQRAPNVVPVSVERRRQTNRVEDFRPTLKLKEGTDVSKIDPTVRVDLLAKLRDQEMKGGTRSVFAFGSAPPPPVPPIDVKALEAKKKEEEAKQKAEADKPKPPPKPQAPPIPLKFFGYSTRTASKRAFFLDGDDIDIAGENEVIKNRYKIIRIGVNSVVVEDTQFKDQQTLPLVEELAG